MEAGVGGALLDGGGDGGDVGGVKACGAAEEREEVVLFLRGEALAWVAVEGEEEGVEGGEGAGDVADGVCLTGGAVFFFCGGGVDLLVGVARCGFEGRVGWVFAPLGGLGG